MNSPDDFEAELLALGEALDLPAPPPSDVARAVRARLEEAGPVSDAAPSHGPVSDAAPSRGPLGRGWWRPGSERRRVPRWRWITTGVAAVLVALVGLTPQGQAAVAHVLRFAGIEIHIDEPGPLPTGMPRPLPGETRVSLSKARETAGFPIMVPAELGEPRDVRVADGGRVVSLFWPGVRMDAYNGVLEVVWRKDLGEPWPEQVTVGSSPGWWITGPHGLTYIPSSGGETETVERVAGPTLIWQRSVVGYRLEGVADPARAKKIAESLR
ncbi:hypothetical protein [Sphaerisporangium corydalis]|uniref:DUF4367 domain-containing protein n=1 Tax=Sphaerisporangium corydalis TaxID=1441875 RepID=A0ABV9EP11_9ACTN|nr:hypothetical protein [Sphaerisporangium corydalis]